MSKPFNPTIIFTKSASEFILEAFGKAIDENGTIIEAGTREPILTPDGDQILFSDFGGLQKGSIKFIKNDLLSSMMIAEGSY